MMKDYLIDKETLEKFVDELIKQRPVPVDRAEDLMGWKEKVIEEVDDRIGVAIFRKLNGEQLAEAERMLDDRSVDEGQFRDFFKNANVDVEKTITEVMQGYAEEFLGGENA